MEYSAYISPQLPLLQLPFIIVSILREDNDEDHEKTLVDKQNDGLGTAAIHIAIYPGPEPGTSWSVVRCAIQLRQQPLHLWSWSATHR